MPGFRGRLKRGSETVPSSSFEHKQFGDMSEIVPVYLDQINIAPQMRQQFDKQGLEDLAHSIVREGQLHPVFIMDMDAELAEKYTGYMNECWNGKVDFRDFVMNPDGRYYILAAGERRIRAMKIIAARENEFYDARCVIRQPTNSAEIISLQVAENIHEAPSALQYAKSIRQAFFIGKKEGLYNNLQDFLPYSPKKEEATRDALRFFELPHQVQQLVEGGALTYSLALELVPLLRAGYGYYAQTLTSTKDKEADPTFVTDEHIYRTAQERVYDKAVMIIGRMNSTRPGEKRWRTSDAVKHIRGVIESMDPRILTLDNLVLRSEADLKAIWQAGEDRRLKSLTRVAEELNNTLSVLTEAGVQLSFGMPEDGLDLIEAERQGVLII